MAEIISLAEKKQEVFFNSVNDIIAGLKNGEFGNCLIVYEADPTDPDSLVFAANNSDQPRLYFMISKLAAYILENGYNFPDEFDIETE